MTLSDVFINLDDINDVIYWSDVLFGTNPLIHNSNCLRYMITSQMFPKRIITILIIAEIVTEEARLQVFNYCGPY